MSIKSKAKDKDKFIAKLQKTLACLHEEYEYKELEASAKACSRLTTEMYDIIYKGEDSSKREVRWKWVVSGAIEMREELEKSRARIAELEDEKFILENLNTLDFTETETKP